MRTLRYSRSSFILALVFSCILTVHRLMHFHGARVMLLLFFGGCLAAAFAGLLLVFNAADVLSDRRDLRRLPGGRRLWSLLYFTILLAVWGYCFFTCCPGNMLYDTGTSILWSLGIDRSNVNNPWFQNLLFGGVYRLGRLLGDPNRGVALYCALQALGYAALISRMAGRLEGSRAASLAAVLLYALIPVFPIYAMTMGKDSNFALALLGYVCLTMELTEDPGQFMSRPGKPLLLAGTVVLAGLLRNHAAWPLLAALGCCFLFVWKERRGRAYLLGLCAALILCSNLPGLLGIPRGEVREALSVPLQQTGYYVTKYADQVTPEEAEKLSAVIPLEALKKYDRDIADPIKKEFKSDPTREELRSYFSAWLSQLKKHPDAYLKAFYLHTDGYYTPGVDKSAVKRRITVGFGVNKQVYQETELTKNANPRLKYLERKDKAAMDRPVSALLSGIGAYAWLLAIAVARLFQKKRYTELICFAAPVTVFVGCLFSPVNGYYRYAFPMILCVPLLLIYAMQLPEKK